MDVRNEAAGEFTLLQVHHTSAIILSQVIITEDELQMTAERNYS